MPVFSILLPSRNRLDLLKLAIQSVLKQDFTSFEIIVSDNASVEDYATHIASLRDRRIRHLRTETALSVTENWNTALKAAVGDYVVMLGDDDALTPGLLRRLNKIIKQERNPTILYLMAYHYLYPNVSPEDPAGSLLEVINSELFSRGDARFALGREEAANFARMAVSFQHMISFNAQHFIWRRDFTQTEQNFFQPPYPDYYACFYTFAKAERIVVVPTASIIIGIAKQSFGFFYLNDKEEEGNMAFGNNAELDEVGKSDPETIKALAFPGSVHYRNWLLTSIRYKQHADPSVVIDFDRYRKIQIVESIAKAIIDDPYGALSERPEWACCGTFAAETWDTLQKAATKPAGTTGGVKAMKASILENLDVYAAVTVKPVELIEHSDIMDAYDHLAALQRDSGILSWFRRLMPGA